MSECKSFSISWRIAACGRPIVECKFPAAVRKMRPELRAHIAERVRVCLLSVIPGEAESSAKPDAGKIEIYYERKERDRIAAGAEVPPGEPFPPMAIRKQIAFDFAELLRKAAE